MTSAAGITSVESLKNKLREPAADIRYLLCRGYRRKGAIRFVSNHYRLAEEERHILTRLVFDPETAAKRNEKRLTCSQLKGCDIFIDGYNVLITMESVLQNETVWFADDGFLRDTRGIFKNHTNTTTTYQAVDEMLTTLSVLAVNSATILLDSQMSNSGKLAQFIRRRATKYPFKTEVRTSKNVDFDLKQARNLGVIATADSVIVDAVERAADLTACWMDQNGIEGESIEDNGWFDS
ncbi:MAG: DUF434 domain-containing protein, partial [Methanohalophilus sp.]